MTSAEIRNLEHHYTQLNESSCTLAFRPPLTGQARWRGNNYVMEDGLLPFQLCSAVEHLQRDIDPVSSHFIHEDTVYHLLITAASAWGETDPNGRPVAMKTLELLTFFTEAGMPVRLDAGQHCKAAPIVPPVLCSLDGLEWWEGSVQNHAQSSAGGLPRVALSTQCPAPAGWLPPDRFTLFLRFSDGPEAVTAEWCYEHVPEPATLVGCTQPLYGRYNTEFWDGVPPYPNHTLLEAAVVYHQRLMGLSVVILDHDAEFRAAAARFAAGGVGYQAGWALRGLGMGAYQYAWQSLAETTCHWEQRARSRMFVLLHAPDTFLLPLQRGGTAAAAAEAVHRDGLSGVLLPSVVGHGADVEGGDPRRNVLQRWGLLGPEFEWSGHVPLGNPRRVTFTWVHGHVGRRPGTEGYMGAEEALERYGVHALHLFALSRRWRNRRTGRPDEALAALADALQRELEAGA
jgi:hypothetical protein